ncbi:MAG TPA: GNAT family N-acetyltransferase, partial [Sulfurovum sp.]
YFTEIDFDKHVAIVATLQEQKEEKIIGVGRYIVIEHRNKQKVAEIAFIIDDKYQHLGIGTILFENLITIAQDNGISIIVADVLLENKNMLELFKHSGFALHSTFELGIEHIEFSIEGQAFNRYYDT